MAPRGAGAWATALVSRTHRVRQWNRDLEEALQRQPARWNELREQLPLDVLHREIGKPPVESRFEDADHVVVRQLMHGLEFTPEPEEAAAATRQQDLERQRVL